MCSPSIQTDGRVENGMDQTKKGRRSDIKDFSLSGSLTVRFLFECFQISPCVHRKNLKMVILEIFSWEPHPQIPATTKVIQLG